MNVISKGVITEMSIISIEIDKINEILSTVNNSIIVSFCELGLGVFAKRNIRRGEIIYQFKGDIIDFLETKRRGDKECMPIQIGPNKYIDTEAPGCYINHSCKPNSGIMDDTILVALQDIEMHTEIRFDYSTTMNENSYTMECLCRQPECRKIITDFTYLPPTVKAEYLQKKIVSKFIYNERVLH